MTVRAKMRVVGPPSGAGIRSPVPAPALGDCDGRVTAGEFGAQAEAGPSSALPAEACSASRRFRSRERTACRAVPATILQVSLRRPESGTKAERTSKRPATGGLDAPLLLPSDRSEGSGHGG
jgi:hypothetical protein